MSITLPFNINRNTSTYTCIYVHIASEGLSPTHPHTYWHALPALGSLPSYLAARVRVEPLKCHWV